MLDAASFVAALGVDIALTVPFFSYDFPYERKGQYRSVERGVQIKPSVYEALTLTPHPVVSLKKATL
jgi:hypothetical protein